MEVDHILVTDTEEPLVERNIGHGIRNIELPVYERAIIPDLAIAKLGMEPSTFNYESEPFCPRKLHV